jgi:hypothetical protein
MQNAEVKTQVTEREVEVVIPEVVIGNPFVFKNKSLDSRLRGNDG